MCRHAIQTILFITLGVGLNACLGHADPVKPPPLVAKELQKNGYHCKISLRADTSSQSWAKNINESAMLDVRCRTPRSGFEPVVTSTVALPFEHFVTLEKKSVGIKVTQIEQSSAKCGKVHLKMKTQKDDRKLTLMDRHISFCL